MSQRVAQFYKMILDSFNFNQPTFLKIYCSHLYIKTFVFILSIHISMKKHYICNIMVYL